MKNLFFTIMLCLFVIPTGSAQEGSLHIEQDKKIADLVNLYKAADDSSGYYRIQIYFGSLDKAQEIKAQAESDFPGWFSEIKFESPSYRVRIGKFKNKLDAQRELQEVRLKYPSAMLLKPEKTTK
ncbi:SPOR domain-containing protein [Flavobacteriaceae bacterium F89]|uniref:SPOR domain-containing protein n=1 Tax=Cerina litoralis TaxID=2874477 RepID=A0AAE3EU62_9FLAO|nr:SPOR domain-containing protein [Cerina litoralis]MCG2460324.1 SPOR domain-containing protein [Cerina litoralis]